MTWFIRSLVILLIALVVLPTQPSHAADVGPLALTPTEPPTPTNTPLPTNTPEPPTPTNTPLPTNTPEPTSTTAPTSVAQPTQEPTQEPTLEPTATPIISVPGITATATPEQGIPSPTPSPSSTPEQPSATPMPTATPMPSATAMPQPTTKPAAPPAGNQPGLPRTSSADTAALWFIGLLGLLVALIGFGIQRRAA